MSKENCIVQIRALTLQSDYDQVKADLASSRHLERFKETKALEDLPGLGEFYCVECAKWFEGEHNLAGHRKGKNHKRRVKELKQEAHSQDIAEAAVGLRQERRNDLGQEPDTMVEG